MKYVPLHVHSYYSMLDGVSSIDEIVEFAKREGTGSIALTDHGVTYGLLEFYKKCKKEGINPILGMEAYFHPIKRGYKELGEKERSRQHHLTILAKNKQGYKNLLKLTSLANIEGFYYTPQIDDELLYEYREGLIVLSGCVSGYIPSLLQKGKYDEALKQAKKYQEWFGDDFYLEIMRHPIDTFGELLSEKEGLIEIPEDNGAIGCLREKIATNMIASQKELEKMLIDTEKGLLELSKDLGIPLVATNDSHYTNKEDAGIHDVVYAMGQGRKVLDPERRWFPGYGYHIQTYDEMAQLFQDIPEAIENTAKIAEKVHIEIEELELTKKGTYQFPKFDVPEGYTAKTYLEKLCQEGWEKLIQPQIDKGEIDEKEYRDRLEYELKVIDDMGFNDFMLIEADFVRTLNSKGIITSHGRGSVGSSLVAYLTGITKRLDPIKYNLIFERFLNPSRVTMPDIDVDVPRSRRKEAIQYFIDKYGREHVAQVGVITTLSCKNALKKVFTALGVPFTKANNFTKMIPDTLDNGKAPKLDDLMKFDNLRHLIETDDEIRTAYKIAKRIEDSPANVGVHAAAVIISQKPLTEYTGLRVDKDGNIITQYTMDDLESLGLLKMDALGIRTLDVIDDTIKAVKKNQSVSLDFYTLPLDDKKTFEFYSEAKYLNGVFQTESSLFRHYLRRLKPQSFQDIIDILALCRPGPLDAKSPDGEGSMVDEFIARKHGRKEAVPLHPLIEDVLSNTHQIITYQEQVMQIAILLAGFTPSESDDLRKVIGDKKLDEIPKQRKKFFEGATKNGVDPKLIETIWGQIETFGQYGFNRSHSAGYGMVSHATAYLKAHYPVEFLAALLTSVMNENERVGEYLEECYEMGINILPPDINISGEGFVADGRDIRFGLNAIKGVGKAAIDEILSVREKYGGILSLADLVLKCDSRRVNKTVLEALIHAGAFDNSGYTRWDLQASLNEILKALRSYKGKIARIEKAKEAITGDSIEDMQDKLDRLEKRRTQAEKELREAIEKASEAKGTPVSRLEMLEKEKELLGMYVSSNPVNHIRPYLEARSNITAEHVCPENNGQNVRFGGILTELKEVTTKNGYLMAFGNIRDHTGNYSVTFSPWVYKQYKNSLQEEAPVFIAGSISSYSRDGEIYTKIDAKTVSVITDEDVSRAISDTERKNEEFIAEKTVKMPEVDIARAIIMVDATGFDPKDEIESIKQYLSDNSSSDGYYPELQVLYPSSTLTIPLMFCVSDEVLSHVETMPQVIVVVKTKSPLHSPSK